MNYDEIRNDTIWQIDWARVDRQRALNGWRAAWWNFNANVSRLVKPSSSLEERMYWFHSRHHAWTFFRISLESDFWRVVHTIACHGILAGMRQMQELTIPKRRGL